MRRSIDRMTLKQWVSLWLFLLLGIQVPVTTLAASAQQAAAPPEKKEVKADGAENADAIDAIEREITQALHTLYETATLVEKQEGLLMRVRGYAMLAQAFWPHDQSRARELFRAALDATKRPPKPDQSKDPRARMNDRDLLRAPSLIFQTISKLDPDWAAELAKSTRPESDNTKNTGRREPSMRRPLGSERSLALLTTAHSLIEQDPKRAGELAAGTLSEGVANSFVGFLTELRKKDRALADALFDQALKATLRKNPPFLEELIGLGFYLPIEMPFRGRLTPEAEALPVNQIRVAQYLNVLMEASATHVRMALNPATATGVSEPELENDPSMLYGLLVFYQPVVMRYLPEQISLVDSLISQLMAKMTPEERTQMDTAEERYRAGPEEKLPDLLQQADQTKDVDERDWLLSEATQEALKTGQFDRALEICLRISDLEERAEVLDYIHSLRAHQALEKNDLETARRSAQELKDPERFVLTHISIAQKLVGLRDKDAALTALSEAESRARGLSISPEKGRSLLHLADALLPLDTNRAVDVLSQAATALNQSNTELEALGPDFNLGDPNLSMRIRGSSGYLIPVIDRIITALVKADPTRAQFAAAAFDRPASRLIAQIALARTQLEQATEKKAKLAPKKPAGS